MKGLMKVFSVGSAILKQWRMIVLIKGCMWENGWVVLIKTTAEEMD